MSADILSPRQARQMDKTDIKNLRYWHRLAARRATAGFDIVYAYVTSHDIGASIFVAKCK